MASPLMLRKERKSFIKSQKLSRRQNISKSVNLAFEQSSFRDATKSKKFPFRISIRFANLIQFSWGIFKAHTRNVPLKTFIKKRNVSICSLFHLCQTSSRSSRVRRLKVKKARTVWGQLVLKQNKWANKSKVSLKKFLKDLFDINFLTNFNFTVWEQTIRNFKKYFSFRIFFIIWKFFYNWSNKF